MRNGAKFGKCSVCAARAETRAHDGVDGQSSHAELEDGVAARNEEIGLSEAQVAWEV